MPKSPKLKLWQRLEARLTICLRIGHAYRFDGHGLTGDYIKCARCGHSEEYIPGVHEPKGYDYEAAHQRLRNDLGL